MTTSRLPRPLTAGSSWWPAAVMVVVVVGYGFCIEPALFGRPGWNAGGLIGGLVGGLWGSRLRESDYWALHREERRRVVLAGRAGRPTGAPRLDAVVLDRLERAARTVRSDRIARVVVTVVVLALPVVATARTGTWWYPFCLVPSAVPAIQTVRLIRSEDPRVRLARFRAATGDAGPGAGVRRSGSGR